MRYLIACAVLLLGVTGAAFAQDAGGSPYYLKYGDEGVERFIYFAHILEKKPKPLTTQETIFTAPEIEDGIAQIRKSEHDVCVRGTEHSLTGSNLTETYALKFKGKTYKVTFVRDICSKRGYDIASKKINGVDADEGNYSKVKVIVNGKTTLDLSFAGEIAAYSFDKDELITEVSECCNADNYYNRHNWVNGKALETDILHINADDIPQLKGQKETDEDHDKALDIFGGQGVTGSNTGNGE